MPGCDDTFIRVDNVSFHFASLAAVQGVSFTVGRGMIAGLVGSDGAGKSTLLRMMATMIRPAAGSITVAGLDVVAAKTRMKRLMGYMPQRFGLYQDLTVGENLDFFMDIFGITGAERVQRRQRYLGFSNLTPFIDRLAGNLSGGMKQKLGLACVLVHEPQVLILDEPTNGVDPVSRQEFWDILTRMKGGGMTIIIATAYIDEGEKCDQLGLLHRSRLLAWAPPAEIKSSFASLEEAIIQRIGEVDRGLLMINSLPEAVAVERLEKRYGAFIAVNKITFSVRQGEIFGFLGPNGSGKSTTIRMLCGIITPTSGYGQVAGHDIITGAEEIKRAIGYMSQKFSLYEDLTPFENLRFYLGIYNVPEEQWRERLEWVLDTTRLQEVRNRLARELPPGWRQRLALGCALLHRPRILFLDEPTAGVDPITRQHFWDFIGRLAGEGITVFVTTHYMDEARHCGRIVMINEGRIVAMGSPGEIIAQTCPGRPQATLNDAFVALMTGATER